jgi:hypothetical protein
MVLGDGREKRLCKVIHRKKYLSKISTAQKKVIHKICG